MRQGAMELMMKHYLTTPIYYASGSPHLGHAYTTFVADCYKHYYQLRGDDVLLVTGTDEHGQKIERTAQAKGEKIDSFIASRSKEFSDAWRDLDVGIDIFQRTTDPQHVKWVLYLWDKICQNGDIYKGQYEGLYCVECEQYFTEGDQCPVHQKPLEQFAEESYFFRLGAYQEKLIEFIESSEDFILPISRRNEVLSFLKKSDLHDLSISRTSTKWGIGVPGDEDHVIYVWLDALAAYLSALGPPGSDRFQSYWRNTTHFIGKDILNFHGVYWPALLWSAGLELPQRLVVNGWLTVEGRKISKSDPATIIDPGKLAQTISCDGLKYYFMKTARPGGDLDFDQKHLVEVLNADLANNVGNLFSRFVKLFAKQFPDGLESSSLGDLAESKPLRDQVQAKAAALKAAVERYELSPAVRCFVETASLLNADFQNKEPWKIVDESSLADYFWVFHHCLIDLTILGSCFTPDLVARARRGLGLTTPAKWQDLGSWCSQISTKKIDVLFPRIQLV